MPPDPNLLAYRGDLTSVQALFSSSPGIVNQSNSHGLTPLLSACRGLCETDPDQLKLFPVNADHAGLILFLLERDCRTDVANARGYGAMTLAAAAGRKGVSVLETLVDYGADPLDAVEPRDGRGANKTARSEFLAFRGSREDWDRLEAKWAAKVCSDPAKVTSANIGRLLMADKLCLEDKDVAVAGILEAWSKTHRDAFRRALSRFVTDTGGKTALMVAAAQGLPETARFLCSTGLVDLDAQTRNSRVTALHMALSYGEIETARALVDGGCDPTVRNDDGHTPVEAARHEGDVPRADLDAFDAHARAAQAANILASAITDAESVLDNAIGALATAWRDVPADRRDAAVAAVTRAMYGDAAVAQVAFTSGADLESLEGTHELDPSLIQAFPAAVRGSATAAMRAVRAVPLDDDGPDARLAKAVKAGVTAQVDKNPAMAARAWRDGLALPVGPIGIATTAAVRLWLAAVVLRCHDSSGASALSAHLPRHEWLGLWRDTAAAALTLGLCEERGALGAVLDRDENIDASGKVPRNVVIEALRPTAARVWDAHREGAVPAIHREAGTVGGGAATRDVATPSQDGLLRGEWCDVQRETGLKSTAVDELMTLTGLRTVKKKMLEIARAIDVRKRQGIDRAHEKTRHHVIFKGNPGTGKTTVARFYARFLVEVGEIPEGAGFYEHTGTDLTTLRLEGVKTYIDDIVENRGGGVLFVDEAYQLQRDSMHGHKIADHLVAEMENRRDKLVVIFAGYKKDIEKLLELNTGLASRFGENHFLFEDYSDEELLSILRGHVAKINKNARGGNFRFEDEKHARIAITRIGTGRGTEGFGNARAVETFVQSMLLRLRGRIARKEGPSDIFLLARDDVLGARPDDSALERSRAYRKLMGMHGLEKVKQRVQALVDIVRENAVREEREEKPLPMTLNAVFIGNPGTGKTTVARLYGELLHDLGVLSKGEYHEKKRADLVGEAVGQTAQRTKGAIEAARGSVLVIDEAYALLQSSRDGAGALANGSDIYGQEAIDTIVGEVHNNAGDDIAVVLVGYVEETRRMINTANPGFQRRFPCDDSSAFVFHDYDDDALLAILTDKLAREDLRADLDDRFAAIEVLSKQRDKPNFGNAGAVNTLLSTALERQQGRIKPLLATVNPEDRAQLTSTLVAADFDPKLAADHEPVNVDTLFDDLIGCHAIRDVVDKFTALIDDARVMGHTPDVDYTFMFTGNPGTGKTTAARRMGQLFHAMGIIATDEVLEIPPESFQTGFVGQAPAATRKMFDEALGKVLFIDEAYKLNPKNGGPFMKEVLDAIVSVITEPKYKGKVVVVLAGYEKDIHELLAVNAGLTRRFTETVHFYDLKPEEALEILRIKLAKRGRTLCVEDDAEDVALERFKVLTKLPHWGNGGDVETVTKDIIAAISQRCKREQGGKRSRTFATAQDVAAAMDQMVTKRKRQAASQAASKRERAEMHAIVDPYALAQQLDQSLHVEKQIERQSQVEIEEIVVEEEEEEDDEKKKASANQYGTDAGVDPAVEEETRRLLEEQKKKEEQERLEAERLQRERERLQAVFEAALQAEADELERRRIQELIRQAEEAERKIGEAQERERKAQEKLRSMGICPAGFQWVKVAGGYRCSRGGHTVPDSQLGL
jgi:ankyrin repeat protein/replication-associated recombination protein RarA